MGGNWHVSYSEITDDLGNGPCSLSIGPHENDTADSFAFSETFRASDGIPDEVEKKFDLMASSPALLTIIERLVLLIRDTEYEQPKSSMRLVSIVSDRKTFDALDEARRLITELKGGAS